MDVTFVRSRRRCETEPEREKHDAVVFLAAVAVGGGVVAAPLADGMAAARADGALSPHIRKYKHANFITEVCG